MTIYRARNILGVVWLVGILAFGLLLFLMLPKLGKDADAIFKQAGTFMAPFVGLVLAFYFGWKVPDKSEVLPNPGAFWLALGISGMHLFILFYGVFVWDKPILENMALVDLALGYFALLTTAAMNFFFVGVAGGQKTKSGH